MKQLFLIAMLFPTWLFSQTDYSKNSAGNPYPSVSAALKQIPKKAQKVGQVVFINTGASAWIFDSAGKLVPVTDSVPVYTSANGATREVNSILSEQLRLEDFRLPGFDDTQTWQAAIKVMQAQHRGLYATRNPNNAEGAYYNRTIIVAGDYWNVICDGTLIRNATGYYKDNDIQPDYSYPTPTDPGPLKGSCFYFTTGIYGAITEGLTLIDFRFGMSFLEPHNRPTFKNCSFAFNCCGVMCYQGMQNYQFLNCTTPGTGTLIIGGATCFPDDSPYKLKDNFFFDGVKIEGGNLSCAEYPKFDTFYRNCILRPTVGSYAIDREPNYIYPYPPESEYCTATGRVVTAPIRNPRRVFGAIFKDIDARSGNRYGLALINSDITGLSITGQLGVETMFENSTDRSPGYFVLGSVGRAGGNVDITGGMSQYSLIKWTRRGLSGGWAGLWDYISMPPKSWVTGDISLDDKMLDAAGHIEGTIGIVQKGFVYFYVRGKKLTKDFKIPDNATLYIGENIGGKISLTSANYDVSAENNTIILRVTGTDPTWQDRVLAAIIW